MPPPENLPRPDRVDARLEPALLACARGEMPPNVALLKLLIEARDQPQAEGALRAARLIVGQPPGWYDPATLPGFL